MSEDIVARLRAAEPCTDSYDGCPCLIMDAKSGCCCAEAADEIERLRVPAPAPEGWRTIAEDAIALLDAWDEEGWEGIGRRVMNADLAGLKRRALAAAPSPPQQKEEVSG